MSYKNFILCLGPRSKYFISGVSLAFDLLISGFKERNIYYEVIDSSGGKNIKKSGAFSIQRGITVVKAVFSTWLKLPKCTIFYATMSTSKLGFFRDFLTVPVAKFMGKKIILHLHGGGFEAFYLDSPEWIKYLIRFNLRKTDKVIVLGELLKRQFFCVGPFIEKKLTVVPNGLTLGVNDPKIQNKSFCKDETVRLIYLSSLMPSKGFMDVIHAIEILKKQFGGGYHLDICGNFVNAITEESGGLESKQDLLTYIKDNNLGNDITYHGQVLGSDKESLLKKAHVFLLPTYYPWEGQPLSIIEAMAYATPIISCKHKGIPEMIDGGINGHFVMPKDPKDIAEKIKAITSSSDKYMNYSEQSRIKYEKDFRREVHLDRLISKILHIK
jgi:glycosyltransferase involved in cell wall biosynthesis